MQKPAKTHPLAMFSAWFLVVFLVLFPKGGFKLGPIPITWGYVFFAVTTAPMLMVRVLTLPLKMPRRLLLALVLIFPLQALCLYAAYFYGILNVGYAVSTLAGVIFLPCIFLLVYGPFLPLLDGRRVANYFRFCIFWAAAWGIFLFVWRPFVGSYIEIPYITVNAADFGEIEATKHIVRGAFFKLISTYNNGNLYGVCTIMLLPLYKVIEPRKWRVVVVRIALLLTLSRSVWAALLLDELLSSALILLRQVPTFPRLHLQGARRSIAALVLTVCFILLMLLFNANNLSFLFDPTLGGRSGMLGLLDNATLLPAKPLFGFQEIVYISAVDQLGYLGGFAYVLVMVSPVILLLLDKELLESPIRRAALKGLVLYSLLAAVDGAFNFIPTTAFYWFLYMIYIFGWPAARRIVASTELATPLSPAHSLPETATAT